MNDLSTLLLEARAAEARPAARRRPDRPGPTEERGDFAAAVAAAEMAHVRHDRPDRPDVDPTERSDDERVTDAVGSPGSPGSAEPSDGADTTDSTASMSSTGEAAEGASIVDGPAVDVTGARNEPTVMSSTEPSAAASTATDPALEGAVAASVEGLSSTTPLQAAREATGMDVRGVDDDGGARASGAGGAAPDPSVLEGVDVRPDTGGSAVALPPAATVLTAGAAMSDKTADADADTDGDGRPEGIEPAVEPAAGAATDVPVDTVSAAMPTPSGAAVPAVVASGPTASADGGADPIASTGPDAAGAAQSARGAGQADSTEATPPPWRQVAAALRTVRAAETGPQAVSLELAPASLGRVRVEATLRDGVLDVKLHAETDRAHQALKTGMAELRRDVEATGVKSGRLEVQPFDRTSGDRSGDALDGRRPDPQGPFADVEPGAGGEDGNGRWRPDGDGSSPGGSATRPLPVVPERASARDLPDRRLDLHL